jgi:hypothetical protein
VKKNAGSNRKAIEGFAEKTRDEHPPEEYFAPERE